MKWWVALWLVGCSATEVVDHPVATPSTIPQRAVADVSPEASEAEKVKRFAIEDVPRASQLEDDTGAAPCDFARSYRGVMNERGVTFALRLDSTGQIRGAVHYDDANPALAVTGSVKLERSPSQTVQFEMTEQAGGTYTGSCDPKTGMLLGTFSGGNKFVAAFAASPRPVEWPPLYRLTRKTVTPPNHPACKRLGSKTEIKEVFLDDEDYGSRIVCLPTDPKARKAMQQDGEYNFGCTVEDIGLRVFGLDDPELEKRINAILEYKDYPEDVRSTSLCNGHNSVYMSASLVEASAGMLVISRFSSLDLGGVHPWNSVRPSIAVDLKRGTELSLSDIVTDSDKLRDVAGACLGVYQYASTDDLSFDLPDEIEPVVCDPDASPTFLWGCQEGYEDPMWTLLPEGIVIGARGNPHVAVALDGTGPILPWDVLLRAGVLRADSPMARLWKDDKPAPAEAHACRSAFTNASIRSWHRI